MPAKKKKRPTPTPPAVAPTPRAARTAVAPTPRATRPVVILPPPRNTRHVVAMTRLPGGMRVRTVHVPRTDAYYVEWGPGKIKDREREAQDDADSAMAFHADLVAEMVGSQRKATARGRR